MASEDYFSVSIFFIVFREALECLIILSILLSFLKQTFEIGSPLYKRLRNQVWIGLGVGVGICVCIGAAFIAVWYTVLSDIWGNSQNIWEGCFSLLATVMITVMGIAMLKTEKLQDKWKYKLAKAMEAGQHGSRKTFKLWMQKYSFFLLPFVTVLREGLEAIVFIGGVSLNVDAKSIPIAVIMGLVCGALVSYLIYRGGSMMKLRWFFIFSTAVLYLIAAGLMSKAVGFFEQNSWNQVIGGESADVISYKVTTAVWHVSWGNPEASTANNNGGWEIFNSILGWNNTATIGTITSYCLYWIMVSAYLVYAFFKERKRAIAKAERGEFYRDDADVAFEKAKHYVNEDGVITGEDENVAATDEVVPVDEHKV